MKKLNLANNLNHSQNDFISEIIHQSSSKNDFVQKFSTFLRDLNIEFYDYVGLLFNQIGFGHTVVSRTGDVNCRFDATIIHERYSIPIEIKSPGEDMEINIKAIRQAFENKIVLLSRGFYNTTTETTSLAVGYNYPPNRSDIYELIDDIKTSFDYNIGIISISDILAIVYDIKVNNKLLNSDYLIHLQGKFENEKALTI